MSRWKIAVGIVVVALVAVLVWRVLHSKPQRGPKETAAVAVTVVPVAQQDVPVFLTALGTVQALNTVTVRAQVSGQIQAIKFTEGQPVKQGDLIAQIDPRSYQAQLEQVQGKQKQDAAQLVAARSTLKRYEDLITRHFVAAQDLENQRQTVLQQQALVAADAAAVDNAKVQLGYTAIRSPIDGIAGIRQVDIGNLVGPSDANGIVVLTEVHPINVIFTLPEQNLDQVRDAQADAPLAVTALNRADSHPIAQGVLKVIDNQIDTTTGTFKLKSEFANQDNKLWPGEFVNVRVQVTTIKGGLVAPAQAVQRGPDGSYVYLLKPDDTVAMQPVKAGVEAANNMLQIASGLNAGDKVVTEGQFRLKPGSKVQPLAPGQVPPTVPADAQAGSGKGGRRGG